MLCIDSDTLVPPAVFEATSAPDAPRLAFEAARVRSMGDSLYVFTFKPAFRSRGGVP